MRKKRIIIHSNHYKMFTGFGKHKKNLLSYLHKTGKYEIIELSNGFNWSSETTKLAPWTCHGTLPDDLNIHKEIQKDQKRSMEAGYGAEMIDHAITTYKPDIYIGIEDIWAFNTFYDKKWWNKVNCIIHTTLDSLPILPDAVNNASKIKNYFVWASFAEKALNKLGHKHVKTIRGIVETKNFYKLPQDSREKLRKRFNLEGDFIIGFVFRNQLRKSVPNLLDGFKIFNEKNPKAKAKLFLHTHWSEGWDIPRLIIEKNIDPKKVITTYYCQNCGKYEIKSFTTQGIKCSYCQHPNSVNTTNIKAGVNEFQLNEIYNLMDVYCHPFTSGGQEIPVQEAKLTELITLVTNYSCGEDLCTEESGGFPLEWAEYREPGTQFIKASTLASSIVDQLQYVYNLPLEIKNKIGKLARQFVLDNFSVEIVGKQFEQIFDSLPFVDFDFDEKPKKEKNINYEPDENLSDKEWVESLYENILCSKDENGVNHWTQRLKTDLKRPDVLTYFRKTANLENNAITKNNILKSLSENDEGKRIAIVMPEHEEDILIMSSLLPSVKSQYPDSNIYFFTKKEYFDLISSNPNVHKVLQYSDQMDDPLFFEGKCDDKKHFEIAYVPYLQTKRLLNFTKNAKDKIQLDLYESR